MKVIHDSKQHRSAPSQISQQLKIILKVGTAIKKWDKQARNSKQRVNILKQWVSTERSYIEDLRIIENNIQKPLKAAKLITREQQRILFPNLKAMVDLSLDLSSCLQAAISPWNPHRVMIGERIKAISKFFMIYRQYCNNFMKGQQIVKELKKNPQTMKIEQKLKLDIESYVIKPVQRPPKYQLLLREYYKALPKSHKDYLSIAEAIQKYHEVNELNNQSMDKQIRVKAMIRLDRLYGGIISSRFGRQYLKQFSCTCLDIRCQIHAFSDMLILLKKVESNPQIWKKITLDYTSYILKKRHLKYSKNMILVCGGNLSAHLKFDTPAEMNVFIENVQQIMKDLQQKEIDKRQRYMENQTKKSNLAKFKVSKWCQDIYFKIQHKPKWEITVEGTMKPNGNAFYFTRFRVIRPFKVSQTLMLTREVMETIEQYMLKKYPNLNIPEVTEGSEAIGFYDTTKNKTQIIEYRSFLYESCLNFIFRNQQFYNSWKELASILGLHFSFFTFSSTEHFNCKCSLCIQLKDHESFRYYVNQNKRVRKHKKVVRSRLMWVKEQESPTTPSCISDDGRDFILYKSMCSAHYFQIMEGIRVSNLPKDADHFDKVMGLEARLGHIDYTLLEPDSKVDILQTPVNIRVKILSVEEQFIDIRLREDRYIRSVIEEIGAKNSLETVYDWGLFLVIDDTIIQMPPDQKILNFARKWKVQISCSEEVDEDSSFLVQKLKKLKQFGGQLLGNGKGSLLFKKWFYFEPQVEIDWCKSNKQRYGFLIDLIYGRFKTLDIQLSYGQIADMCALYLLRSSFEKVKYYYTAENLDSQSLKDILPSNCWPYLKEQGFRVEVFNKVKNWYEDLCQLQNQRNAIQIIYSNTLEALKANSNWLNRNFRLSSYKGQHQNDINVSVNMHTLVIKSRDKKEKMLELGLLNLKYRVTTFSIFIESNYREYRYDGPQVLDIKNLVEAYKIYWKMVSSAE